MAASPSIQPSPVQALGLPPWPPYPQPPLLRLPPGLGWGAAPCLPLTCAKLKVLVCLSQVLLSCTLFTCLSRCNPAGSLLGRIKVCGHKRARQRSKGQVFQVMAGECHAKLVKGLHSRYKTLHAFFFFLSTKRFLLSIASLTVHLLCFWAGWGVLDGSG